MLRILISSVPTSPESSVKNEEKQNNLTCFFIQRVPIRRYRLILKIFSSIDLAGSSVISYVETYQLTS